MAVLHVLHVCSPDMSNPFPFPPHPEVPHVFCERCFEAYPVGDHLCPYEAEYDSFAEEFTPEKRKPAAARRLAFEDHEVKAPERFPSFIQAIASDSLARMSEANEKPKVS